MILEHLFVVRGMDELLLRSCILEICFVQISEHHVAEGEVCSWQRPGELIPSGRLRDHGVWHRAGRELSHGDGHRDSGAGIGPEVLLIRCTH